MLATLYSYENHFGPHHPQTISLMAQLGVAYWQAGRVGHARPLLEKSIRHLARFMPGDGRLRLRVPGRPPSGFASAAGCATGERVT